MSPVLVIGGHVDAQVAARCLARAGRRVIVIEEQPEAGMLEGWFPPQIALELGADVAAERRDPWLSVALPGGGTLDLWRDIARSAAAIRPLSTRDSERWPAFCARMARLARMLESLYLAHPAEPLSLPLAMKVRRLGRQGMEDLMRLAPMPIAEWLDEWFESDALKGALGAMGIRHLHQGPRSAGTGFAFLHHHVGCPAGVFRWPRMHLQWARDSAIEVRSGKVARIEVHAGRVTAVSLDNGERLDAALVVSGAAVRRTLLHLLDPGWLDPELAREVSHVRSRGVVAKVRFPAAGSDGKLLAWAPSLDYLERAYDHAKYGRISAHPYVEAQGAADALDVHFQYAPWQLESGSWRDERRSEIALRCVELLAPFVSGLQAENAQVLAPPDLESVHGWPQGQAYDAELALDQALWMRPLPELARYRTPVEGLWMCGAGMHPGAAVHGAAGWHCARAILGR